MYIDNITESVLPSLVEEGKPKNSKADSNNVIEEKRKQEERCNITDHKSVNAFLSSMLRNSQKSKNVYKYGLAHFSKVPYTELSLS